MNLTFILPYSPLQSVFLVLAVALLFLLITIGNTFVVLAILLDRRLKGTQNWFLASLAMADFFLGLLVLPLSLSNQVLGYWLFGRTICVWWMFTDVLLCTASILNLCLISIDRYFTITRPMDYPQKRTPRNALLMIAAVWLLAALISMPPLTGWAQRQDEHGQEHDEHLCQLTNDISYVLYSACGSFYIPLVILCFLYAKIFLAARRRIHKSLNRMASTREAIQQLVASTSGHSAATFIPLPTMLTSKLNAGQYPFRMYLHKQQPASRQESLSTSDNNNQPANLPLVPIAPSIPEASGEKVAPLSPNSNQGNLQRRKKLLKVRERRATLVLSLILGAFVASWFPFFTTYIVATLCRCVHSALFDFFFWLGYCNSALNPIIYTLVNRDFRSAFHHLLTGQTCRQ